jgi:hypothetical protein
MNNINEDTIFINVYIYYYKIYDYIVDKILLRIVSKIENVYKKRERKIGKERRKRGAMYKGIYIRYMYVCYYV